MGLQGCGGGFRKASSFLGCAICLLFLASRPILAQTSAGIILGVVRDTSAAAIPQANVTVLNTDTNEVRKQTTGDDGAFRFPALAPGHYSLKVEKEGFETETNTGLTLEVTQQMTLDLTMHVGATQQNVTVNAEAPLVNTTTAALGGVVDEQRMTDLPLNGRNYLDLALQQSGVTLNSNVVGSSQAGGTEGEYYSASGSTLRSNSYTLDGASLVNMRGGNPGQEGGETLGVDGIQEFRVVTSTFDASYGLVSGSQIVMVSKGGTNQFHGDGFEYLRNSALDSRNYFDTTAGSGGHRLPEFRRNNFGGAFGGPIQKDKTFFYAVYEGLRQTLGQTVIDNVAAAGCHGAAGAVITNIACPQLGATPSVTIASVTAPMLALFPVPNLPNNEYTLPAASPGAADYGQIRVDHVFSLSDTFFGRYTTDRADLGSYGSGVSSGNTAGFTQFQFKVHSRDHFLTLSENHIFSSTLLNTLRVSYSRTHLDEDNYYPDGAASLTSPELSYITGAPIGPLSIGGLTGFGVSQSDPQYAILNTYNITDDLNYTKGKHALRFGALLNRYNNGMQQADNRTGSVSFSSLANFLLGIPRTWSGQGNGLAAIVARNDMFDTFGFYVQDDWRALPRLTVNLGLRWESMTVPNETGGYENALRNPLTDANTTPGPMFTNPTSPINLQPRVGLAWDVTGNGKLAVRAGFGIYDDVGNITSMLFSASRGDFPYTSLPTHTNSTNAVLTLPITFTAAEAHNFLGFDYHQNTPYMEKYSLTIERQLPSSMSVAISYVGTEGVHLPHVEEANPEIPTTLINGIPTYNGTNVRANPNWPGTVEFDMVGVSSYNALQLTLNKRITHGLAIQSSYTYSHLIDDEITQFTNSDCSSSGMILPIDDWDKRYDRGPACYDLTNVFNFNTIYHFPNMHSEGFASKMLNGWWTAGILTAESGYPFTPIGGTQRSESGSLTAYTPSDRVDLGTATTTTTIGTKTVTFVPYDKNTVITHNPAQWYNPLMFELDPVGTLGNAGRGILRGPGLANLTFSLVKDTPLPFLGEAGMLEFRSEFFNILNHANFAMPNGQVFNGTLTDLGPYSEAPNATAGQITGTVTTSRQIQFALRVTF